MNDQDLLRYSRHIMLPEIDLAGQQRLLDTKVLVVGLGGLGSPLALYLAAAGVGELYLADGDEVDLSNLQRQVLHFTPDVEKTKSRSAVEKLKQLNPGVRLYAINEKLAGHTLDDVVAQVDIVADCSDNFPTRFAVNQACVDSGAALVSAALNRMEGQLSSFLPQHQDSPCYRCLFPDVDESAQTCSETGVLAPLAGVMGSLQAVEVIKVALGIGQNLMGRLLLFNALNMQMRIIKLRRDPACPACGKACFASSS